MTFSFPTDFQPDENDAWLDSTKLTNAGWKIKVGQQFNGITAGTLISALGTVDPHVVGQLWSSGGTVICSAG